MFIAIKDASNPVNYQRLQEDIPDIIGDYESYKR